MSSVPERSEIDEEYQWSIDSIYADDEAWEEAYEECEERLDDLRAYEGRATESAATLRELLDTYETVFREVSQVTSYARLRSNEDTRDQEYQAMATRAQALSSEASSASSYLEPELQELSWEEVEALLDEEPALREYEHYLDDVLRMKPHTRSA